jgi:Ca2+-binding EF-hand superfamily protein
MSIQEFRDKILRSSEISKTHNASLTKFFSEMDINHSNAIDFNEFKIGLESIGLKSLSEESKIDLFSKFDKKKSGKIRFNDFIATLKPPMANSRLNVIDEAFNKLDANKDGVLSIEDFRVHYDNQAKLHPKYINGEWTKDQVLEIHDIFTSYNKSNLYINRYYKAFLMHSILQANETVL